ncbi:MAG TPA: AMP-binding protein, partial [Polyangia bacterium]
MNFAPAEVDCRRRDDGTIVLESPQPLAAHPPSLTARLGQWAERAPERLFLAERAPDGGWRRLTYGEAWTAARGLAGALLDAGLGPTRPLAILSGNSIDHALVTLAAMYAGVPVAPISTAYSLMSRDFQRLRAVFAELAPAAVFVDDRARFAAALEAVHGRVTTPSALPDVLAELDVHTAVATDDALPLPAGLERLPLERAGEADAGFTRARAACAATG